MQRLFDSLKIKNVTLRNRIGISTMRQRSSNGGVANDRRLMRLGSRAIGGAGLWSGPDRL